MVHLNDMAMWHCMKHDFYDDYTDTLYATIKESCQVQVLHTLYITLKYPSSNFTSEQIVSQVLQGIRQGLTRGLKLCGCLFTCAIHHKRQDLMLDAQSMFKIQLFK